MALKEIIGRAIIDSGLSVDFLQEVQKEHDNAPACIQILVLRMAEKITNDKITADIISHMLNRQFKLS